MLSPSRENKLSETLKDSFVNNAFFRIVKALFAVISSNAGVSPLSPGNLLPGGVLYFQSGPSKFKMYAITGLSKPAENETAELTVRA